MIMVSEKEKQRMRNYRYTHRAELQQYSKEYSKSHREKSNIASKKSQQKTRLKVIKHYSQGKMCCACCGESIIRFLNIDHIDNDGYKYKFKGEAHSSHRLWYFLIKHNFPDGYQVLCFNCNLGKSGNKGICPHQNLVKQY